MAFFVSEKELERLRRIERNHEDVKVVEKRFNKQIEDLALEHEEQVEDLEDRHDRELHQERRSVVKLERKVKSVASDTKAEFEEEKADIAKAHNQKLDDLNIKIRHLETENEDLEERTETVAELKKRERDLDLKAAELEADQDELLRAADIVKKRRESVEAEEKALKARVADLNDTFYKQGHTDGVADTLRENVDTIAKVQEKGYALAEKALDRETTIITTTQAPLSNKQPNQGK